MSAFLLVDDSPRKMQFLRSMVERARWKGPILEAMTTEDAKDVIDKNPGIVAAFVDYYVPSKCGPWAIAYLKETIPHAKIALVSSSDNEENAEEARSAGADIVVCSSLELDLVEKQLLEILEEWKASV